MAKAWKVKGIQLRKSYRWNAQVILPVRVEEVYSWAASIRQPDNIKALHDMRISVKRLRYSMEFFAINYGETFNTLLKVVEGLQELLGDIHDCDVRLQALTDYLQNLRGKSDASLCESESAYNPAENLPACGTVPIDAIGINALIARYRELREATYQSFLQKWDDLEQTNFKGQLLETIDSYQK
ncbi:CHAD domain-containing protein [Candidatus Poribacteria bacterium]|nr:CHAD domain-containing protein [Candidatus Poribacteria bacterium]